MRAGLRRLSSLARPLARRSAPRSVAMATTIGTHSGAFHCDEALGAALLQRTAAFGGARVVRSRDPAVLAECDVVIDVGGVYDPVAKRFDHHQREFQEVFGHGFTTRLSSAGLVYKHYGREVVAGLMAAAGDGGAPAPPSDADVDAVYLAVYKSFMEAVDAIDNGVNQYESDAPPRYVNGTTLSSRVGGLNPAWNEDQSNDAMDAAFTKAVALTWSEFEDAVRWMARAWLPARGVVVAAMDGAKAVDASGAIVELATPCPWKEHLYALEEERGCVGSVKFVIYRDDREGKWRVQAVSKAFGVFENRVSLPAAWRGLRDGDLDAAAAATCGAPPGGVFVHASGFIGGHVDREGVLAYARAALAEATA